MLPASPPKLRFNRRGFVRLRFWRFCLTPNAPFCDATACSWRRNGVAVHVHARITTRLEPERAHQLVAKAVHYAGLVHVVQGLQDGQA